MRSTIAPTLCGRDALQRRCGDALRSCTHAGVNEPVPGGDYAAVLQLLLDDGAPVPQPEPHWPDTLATVAEQAAAWAVSRARTGSVQPPVRPFAEVAAGACKCTEPACDSMPR